MDDDAKQINREVGARARAARLAAGLKQGQVAETMGVTDGAVSFWERGEREWTVPILLAYAAAVGVEARILMPPPADQLSPDEAAVIDALRTEGPLGAIRQVTDRFRAK